MLRGRIWILTKSESIEKVLLAGADVPDRGVERDRHEPRRGGRRHLHAQQPELLAVPLANQNQIKLQHIIAAHIAIV